MAIQDIPTRRLMSLYKFDAEAYEFYLNERLQPSFAMEKAEQASWLKVLLATSRRQAMDLGFESKRLLYLNACNFFATRNWRGWKSTSIDYLYKRMQYFRKDKNAYRSLLSGKYGNANSRRVRLSREQAEVLIKSYRGHHPRTFKGAYKRYMNIAQNKIERGEWGEKDKNGKFKALLSLSAAKQILKRLSVLHFY